jgi:hypothetical protein
MRRFFSITAIVALLFSGMSPLAAACTGSGKVASCHMEAASHCDRAMHHHQHQTDQNSSGMFAVESDSKCPMDCCTPGHPQTGTVLASSSPLPPLAAAKHKIQMTSVIFLSAGFSSHTDRGPPTA